MVRELIPMLIILTLVSVAYLFLTEMLSFAFVINLAVTLGCIGYVVIYYYRTK